VDWVRRGVRTRPKRRRDNYIAVILSMGDYERLRSGNIQAFLDLRKQIADQAAANGFTDERLNELLMRSTTS
jgi:hypothetical protein